MRTGLNERRSTWLNTSTAVPAKVGTHPSTSAMLRSGSRLSPGRRFLSGQMNSRGPQGLLTLLTAPMVAEYTTAGWWGDETIYRLALRHARTTPDAFALRDRH